MPLFRYRAKNKYGETVQGRVEAQSKNQAAAELNSRQLLVIAIQPIVDDSFAALKAMFFGIKQNDIVNFTRQLATMITAGLPLASALSILMRQGRPEMAKMVGTLLQEVEGGSTFSKALANQKKLFSRIYVQLVNAGETGGVLDQVLERLADNMEKEKEFRGKTRGALIYPVIVVIAMLVVGGIMIVFVIPKLTQMYDEFGAELPLATRILMGLSSFMVRFWYVVLAMIAGAIAGLKAWKKTPQGDEAFDRFLFKLPVFGELRKKIVLTDFTRALALLLGAGVSLLQSLEIVTEALESVIYRKALKNAASQVEKGVALSQAISTYEEFPPILHQMMGVGEETGKLDDILHKVSRYFESESDQAVKNMTAAIEPMIMIMLGIGVGGMVVAIIAPIYNLTAQL